MFRFSHRDHNGKTLKNQEQLKVVEAVNTLIQNNISQIREDEEVVIK